MYSVTESFISWVAGFGYEASSYPPADGDEFVTVERTGGPVEDMVDHPTIAIQTWAKTEVRAEEMAVDLRNKALTSPHPVGVAHISVNSGPYPFWDDQTKLPRYQVVIDCSAQLTD